MQNFEIFRSANSFFNSVEWSRIIWREHSITCGSLKAPKVIPRTKVCERYFKGSWWTAMGIYVVSGNVLSLAAWSILIVVSSVDLTICFVRDGRIRNLSVEINSLLAPHISLAVFPSGSMTSHALCPYAMPILFLCASGDGRWGGGADFLKDPDGCDWKNYEDILVSTQFYKK